jgi:hypothetical protein
MDTLQVGQILKMGGTNKEVHSAYRITKIEDNGKRIQVEKIGFISDGDYGVGGNELVLDKTPGRKHTFLLTQREDGLTFLGKHPAWIHEQEPSPRPPTER